MRTTALVAAMALAMTLGSGPPPSTDPYAQYVISLLHLDGADASTVFMDECGYAWTPASNAQVDTAQSKFGGASLLLDGVEATTHDKIIAPNNSLFQFANQDFCVEAQIRLNTLPPDAGSPYTIFAVSKATSSDYYSLRFRITNTGALYLLADNGNGTTGGVVYTGTAGLISAATWHHVALVRNGNTLYLYVDGAAAGSVALTGTLYFNAAAHEVNIGVDPSQHGTPALRTIFDGHIDEFRVTKGHARYTAAFTPPTAAFPNPERDAFSSYVGTLLHFDGVDGGTTFTDEAGNIWTATASAQLDTAQSKFGGASLLLNGTSDYVSSPDSRSFYVSGDFTVEAWVRTSVTGGSGVYLPIFSQMDTGSNNGRWMFGLTSGNITINGQSTSGVSWTGAQAAYNVPANTWVHVAATRQGNVFRVFANGVMLDERTTSVTIQDIAQPMYIGLERNGGVLRYYSGHIDEFRITNGAARYTAAFTPPTVAFFNPHDPYISNATALLAMNGTDGSTTFTDQTGLTWTANGNAQIDTAFFRFGGASGLFDGTGDYLTTAAHTSFDFGSGEYTIEMWIRPTATGDRCLFDNRGASVEGIAIYSTVTSGGTNSMTIYNNTVRICSSSSAALTQNVWSHVAVVRDGTTVRVYINGVQTASGTDSRTYGTGSVPAIGANYIGTQGFSGSIDDFRITKGVCRYPSGVTFVAPQGQYPLAA